MHNVLIADDYDRGIRLRYDLLDFSLIPDFGNVKISPDYANRYPSFVHWDRRAGVAWYSHHFKMIGFNRNNQVVKSIEQSFQISNACYSKSLNAIVVLGDKPLHWSVIKLDGTVDGERENGSGQREAKK